MIKAVFSLGLLGLIASCSTTTKHIDHNYQELELRSLSQLSPDYPHRFDLSGIVENDGRYFTVADKGWNKYIYEIDFASDFWILKDSLHIPLSHDNPDLEAIDICDGLFYISDESNNLVYTLDANGDLSTQKVAYDEVDEKPQRWKTNTGMESLAVDCQQDILYLAKEREPRYILVVELSTGKILDKFNIPETESSDFSDMKQEDGFIYLLERNGNFVAKVDPKSKEVVDKVAYRSIASHPDGKLYEPSKYGMAEALLLSANEIWIGLDNNFLEVSEHAKSVHGMQGRMPVILKFTRPEGF